MIPALVAKQAAATPDAIAVVDGTRETTYAELDRRANRLAHHLIAQGASPERLVGVCLDRGTDLVVALLAIWKAGAGYLPLNPEHPVRRLTWVLADTGADLVLTSTAYEVLVSEAGATAVTLTEFPEYPADAPESGVTGQNVAYAIYTSGSTGQPKGVVIEHAGIANRVAWTVARHELGAGDRVLHKTPLTFDASCWEIFAPLISGAAVVLAPRDAERSPATIVRAVNGHRITVLQVVPSLLRLLVEEAGWPDCSSLRLVFSAGEQLTGGLAARMPASAEIWNTYGPTECSIDATAFRFDPAEPAGAVPIGRPIKGLRVLVLDTGSGNPALIGAVGELYVGGIGVARGYLGRADLTAARFVPDPYSDGGRLYRTGDLVRWRPDGHLEYLGRADDQLKLNGVRIEPAEVEAALIEHPGVLATAVVAASGLDGQPRLVAYVRLKKPDALEQLRDFLGDLLPATHLPHVFVPLDEFPLTSSGKVDRNALPAHDFSEAKAGKTALRNETERRIAKAWQQLLGVGDIGADDSFFELGGTSLTLTRLANHLREILDVDISLRGWLKANTLRELATLVAAASPPANPLRRIPRDGPLPLSPGQRRLWLADQVDPGSAEWVAPVFLRMAVDTPAELIGRALDTLVARHESLRTRYEVVDGEPRQVVCPPRPVELRTAEVARAGLDAVLAVHFDHGFDLAEGPLLRALLVEIPGEERILALAIHHIASDGWSASVLHRDFTELIEATRTGRDPVLPALPIQYADFASWERERLTEDVLAHEAAHWRTTLDGLARLDLPADRPRPPIRDHRGATVPVTVPAEVVTALDELGRSHDATPFMTVLTAYATVLARYGGQWDVPVGAPVAGRDRPELENLAGFFLNSVVLRCALDPAMTFASALDRVRQVCRDAFAHADLPFDRLVEALDPERDPGRTPLYQAAFDFHGEGFTGSASGHDDLRSLHGGLRVAKTDLTLYLRQQPDGSLLGVLEYATALFDRGTVERIGESLRQLLTELATNPGERLGRADLIPAADRHRMLVTWNETGEQRPELCLHQLIEAQVAATPDAVATESAGVALSYGELDARANQVAHRLVSLGVRRESVVGVLLDRGRDLLATFLGIWKAGAAYLPIDPSYPGDRVRHLLADSAAVLAVTGQRYSDRVSGTPRLVVDDPAEAIGGESTEPPLVASDPDQLAYVIYTSGSTGRPKGVQITHRGLVNHVLWAAGRLAAGSGGAPVFSSVAFDLVVPNVWAPLLAGQRVWWWPQESTLDNLGADLAAAGPFAFLKLTPGHLDVLCHQLSAEQASALAPLLVVAGEVLPGRLVERWRELAPDAVLLNEYGPTETSVGTSVHEVPVPVPSGLVPIGAPLPNVTMYVLDAALRPVPLGVFGELFVGGDGVGRGYLGRADLTAQRYLPDPFGPPGARLYRTGDVVRWLSGGAVEFAGRADDQVKIRGFRVEPGEIRAVLEECAEVAECVVVARAGQLVAYYVPVPGPELPVERLLAHCATALPDYLIPDVLVPLAALPLNANGKVDRAALPDPGPGEQTGPATLAEERIAEIWAELLGREPGVHADFFASGGNSILAIKLIAEVRDSFDIDLPVRAVFERPTIATLAELVADLVLADVTADAPEIRELAEDKS